MTHTETKEQLRHIEEEVDRLDQEIDWIDTSFTEENLRLEMNLSRLAELKQTIANLTTRDAGRLRRDLKLVR